MKRLFTRWMSVGFILLAACVSLQAQTIRGEVLDANNSDPLIGANIVLKDDRSTGTVTDWDGSFELRVPSLPITLNVSYIGYEEKDIEVTSTDSPVQIKLGDDAVTIDLGVEVKGQRVSEKQKAAPLTIESMDLLAIKETPADNFYDGLGSMKGVDLTAASLGFKVINTRGFNSTSPVRSLQIIDGVDNQAPGLNFSLGNFLGSSELDVLKVDLIQGAASAFYGPNAFNGVISMETKNPFYQKGFSAMIKGGERNLVEGAVRWADAINNKAGNPVFGYKLNFSYLRADDWEAENYGPVDGTISQLGNPGGVDGVNTYGDEFFSLNDFSDEEFNLPKNTAGLGLFHRTAYNEIDLVDYNTRNLKANVALHFRTKPSETDNSPEFIVSSSMGNGTTVYQGDNRFSLRNILFFQNRLEYRKKGKYFIRAYATHENAGNSYDPYFTALRLQELAKSNELWGQDYTRYWQTNIYNQMVEMGYPTPTVDPTNGFLIFDFDAARDWLNNHQDELAAWHEETGAVADQINILNDDTQDFFEPGTPRYEAAFDSITALKNTEGGTRFFDKSALYHINGEYNFTFDWLDELKVGASFRQYRPVSEGTVFKDSAGIEIINSEFGVYAGFQKKFTRKWIATATFRMDKNNNFQYLFTPAASLVYSPNAYNYLRFSFSSGVRNPTLTDQYLDLDIGPATLLGNLGGYEGLFTLDSFLDFIGDGQDLSVLEDLTIDPVKPERVKTFELGYRTTLWEKFYIDASYYFNIYDDFIGYNIAVDADIDEQTGIPTNVEVFRITTNSVNQITTQGFSIGLNYYFAKYYKTSANYSWNRLNKVLEDDPIIPAFNTPEHKFNLGLSGRNIPINLGFATIKNTGFSLNYKWIEGFVFEGSPQFTGIIDNYGLLDAQINVNVEKINTTFKLGASNLLNNKVSQTYGGPRIGRLAYISFLYEFKKR